MNGVVLEFTSYGFYACDGIGEGISLPLSMLGNLRESGVNGLASTLSILAVLRQAGCEQCPKFTVCRMSHWTQVETSITDLRALELAVIEMGLAFDGPGIARGIGVQTEGERVIRLKCGYDVAVKLTAGGKYSLVTDYYGGHVAKEVGENCGKLLQMYGVHKATLAAKAKGYLVRRESLTGGNVRLHVTVTA